MSITAVPISIRLVRAPIAASSGNGEASCRAKWCTRTYAPSMPICSAASASSIVWLSASAAVRVREPGAFCQWPKLRNPIRLRILTHDCDPLTHPDPCLRSAYASRPMLDAGAQQPAELRHGRVTHVVVRQAHGRHACGGEDRKVLPAVLEEPLLEAVAPPPIQLHDQAMLGEAGVDSVAADIGVDLWGRQAVLAQERQESVLQDRAGRLRLRELEVGPEQRCGGVGRVAGDHIGEVVE